MSSDKKWIAVSNHGTHSVLIYENSHSLNERSKPVGILEGGAAYPHGVRFSFDNRVIHVADAGGPYVHMYEKSDSDWRGIYKPFRSLRVLNDEDFLRGRDNPEEGGPKGIDVSHPLNVLVSTCETQPLAFFDLRAAVEGARVSTQEDQTFFSSTPNTSHTSILAFRKGLQRIKTLKVICQLMLWRLKREIRWKVQSIQRRIQRLTDRNRIAGWVQSVSHPSFVRFLCYYILFLTRQVSPNWMGDRTNIVRVTEKASPIRREMPLETTTSDEISKVIFQTWKS